MNHSGTQSGKALFTVAQRVIDAQNANPGADPGPDPEAKDITLISGYRSLRLL